MNDEIFTMAYVTYEDIYYPPDSFTERNATVLFPGTNQYCIVNGRKNYINVKTLKDFGWSVDGLYRKIATPAFMFWVDEKDADRLLQVLTQRQRNAAETRKEHEIFQEQYTRNFLKDLQSEAVFDPVDASVAWCYFGDNKSFGIRGLKKVK